MYVVINGDTTHYNVSLESFTTQHGNKAIRFIGDEIPTTDKGFRLYDDNDEEVLDLSEYKYEYRQNEYTVTEEEIQSPSGNNEPLGPTYSDIINKRISDLNTKVNYLTPYEETKKAYYGEKEKTFFNVPSGNVTIFFDSYEGEYITSRIGDRFIISFPETLTKATNITVMVQK